MGEKSDTKRWTWFSQPCPAFCSHLPVFTSFPLCLTKNLFTTQTIWRMTPPFCSAYGPYESQTASAASAQWQWGGQSTPWAEILRSHS